MELVKHSFSRRKEAYRGFEEPISGQTLSSTFFEPQESSYIYIYFYIGMFYLYLYLCAICQSLQGRDAIFLRTNFENKVKITSYYDFKCCGIFKNGR